MEVEELGLKVKHLPNGNEISLFMDITNLGGLEARLNHHEWGHVYNFPLITGGDEFKNFKRK